MEFMHEYGLLIAVALPIGVVAVLNVALALSGESGTLLWPSLRRLPSVALPEAQAGDAEPEVVLDEVEEEPQRKAA